MAKLNEIIVKYLDKIFMENFSLDFGEDFCAVFGQSGSGKTTVAHVFAGLKVIEGGEVFIAGAEIGDVPPKLRNVSLISKDTPLNRKMVKGTLVYPLKLRKKENLEESLKNFEPEFLNKKVSELKDDERAKVYFYRAMIKEPRLIIVDEAGDFLGEVGRKILFDLLKSCNKNVIWLTSDFQELEGIQNIKILKRGKIVFEGSIEQLKSNPVDSYTALLCGYNVLDGFALLPSDFFKGEEKIEVEVKSIETLEKGYYLNCEYKGLSVKIFSDKKINGKFEVCYDKTKAIKL